MGESTTPIAGNEMDTGRGPAFAPGTSHGRGQGTDSFGDLAGGQRVAVPAVGLGLSCTSGFLLIAGGGALFRADLARRSLAARGGRLAG